MSKLIIQTTLFVLIEAAQAVVVEGYEIEEYASNGDVIRLVHDDSDGHFYDFKDQVVEFAEGQEEFLVPTTDGGMARLVFYAARPVLTLADLQKVD